MATVMNRMEALLQALEKALAELVEAKAEAFEAYDFLKEMQGKAEEIARKELAVSHRRYTEAEVALLTNTAPAVELARNGLRCACKRMNQAEARVELTRQRLQMYHTLAALGASKAPKGSKGGEAA
jgi:hypothetical protein